MSTQQQAQAGDNARIIQIYGDNNYVGDSPHLFITPLPPARPAPTEPAKDEASLLRPVVEATAFAGREQLLADFVAWANVHEAARPVSMRVVHGGAGVGKTRFALELCRALGPDWQAGFVPGREAQRALGTGNLGAWEWRKPTLVVFDYALSLVETLRVWLEELCAATPRTHPLRILLLERQADAQAGWLERLFQGGFGLSETMPRELLDGEPLRLPDLSSPAVRIGIMQNMLARLGSAVALPADDSDFQARLAATDWAGAPLYLMMAAMVMHQRGGVGEVLHLGRVDLAQFVATHEYERLRRPCGDNASMQILIAHMAAFATLRGGIGARELSPCLAREREALGCDSGDVAKARRLLSDLLPDGGEGVAPIQPDIVGEAFLLNRLADGRQTEGMDAVLRAFGDRPSEVAAVLVRCVQDFVPRLGRGATGQMVKAQQRAMEWFRELGEMPELPLEMLLVLVDALPQNTEALRSLAADWQGRAVARLRFAPANTENISKLAGSLNNLAIRFRQAGRLDEGIAAARQSVSIRRDQALLDSGKFLPALALSLTTLANCLSHAGQHDDALAPAQEAVDIRRKLFDAEPDIFRQDLAHSLNILAIVLGLLQRPKEALPIAREATDLFRELATTNPTKFRSHLAASLTSLSNRLREAKQPVEAIDVGRKAVAIYREMVAVHPDAYRPELAMSLNNLAHKLNYFETIDEALPLIREAASLYRECAAAYPDVFKPDLAMSLNNLAAWLGKSGQLEEALPIIHEAVTIRRDLVATNPAAFLPDLATSLSTMVLVMLGDTSQRETALAVAREAAGLSRALMKKRPDVFRDAFRRALISLLALSQDISWQEAAALLMQDFQTNSRALIMELDKSNHPTN